MSLRVVLCIGLATLSCKDQEAGSDKAAPVPEISEPEGVPPVQYDASSIRAEASAPILIRTRATGGETPSTSVELVIGKDTATRIPLGSYAGSCKSAQLEGEELLIDCSWEDEGTRIRLQRRGEGIAIATAPTGEDIADLKFGKEKLIPMPAGADMRMRFEDGGAPE